MLRPNMVTAAVVADMNELVDDLPDELARDLRGRLEAKLSGGDRPSPGGA